MGDRHKGGAADASWFLSRSCEAASSGQRRRGEWVGCRRGQAAAAAGRAGGAPTARQQTAPPRLGCAAARGTRTLRRRWLSGGGAHHSVGWRRPRVGDTVRSGEVWHQRRPVPADVKRGAVGRRLVGRQRCAALQRDRCGAVRRAVRHGGGAAERDRRVRDLHGHLRRRPRRVLMRHGRGRCVAALRARAGCRGGVRLLALELLAR